MDRVLSERWFGLSLIEQIVSIGLEVRRAFQCDDDKQARDSFFDKAIKYTQLTIEDPKTPSSAAKELKISKEVLEDYKGEHFLDVSKEQILNYYNYFFNLLQNRPVEHRAAQRI